MGDDVKNWIHIAVTSSTLLAAASLSSGCATTDDGPRYSKGDREYLTGSRIPRRDSDGSVQVLGRDSVEALQQAPAPSNDGNPSPPRSVR